MTTNGPGKRELSIRSPEDGAPRALAFLLETGDGRTFHAYQYPHPAVAATVVVFDRRRRAFLLIRREHDPFRDHYAFPGGFLDVGRETTEQTAVRELEEETGVRIAPADLSLIDVRSAPDRDPRDHVLDIAYYAEVNGANAEARDETLGIRWASEADLNGGLPLAFDHADLWGHVRALRHRFGGLCATE